MKNFATIVAICIFTILIFIGCSKNEGQDITAPGNYPSDLKGTIYYNWATEGTLQITLPGGTGGDFLPYSTKLNNFDISRDNKSKLTVVNASSLGNDNILFTISDIQTGDILEEFTYNGPGRSAYNKGYLSPDNSLILVTSNQKEDGITILKRNGEYVTRLLDINGEPAGIFETILWLPGNHLLLTHGDYIIRLAPPYTSGTLVKEMNYQDWGKLTVNVAGTQLAMNIAKHIYTMDIDGTNLKQVTVSNFTESVPVFSPDGKYLLVGSHYRQSGPMGHVWELKIIPNDGQQYNTDPVEANSPEVIPVIWKGKDRIEFSGGQMIWR